MWCLCFEYVILFNSYFLVCFLTIFLRAKHKESSAHIYCLSFILVSTPLYPGSPMNAPMRSLTVSHMVQQIPSVLNTPLNVVLYIYAVSVVVDIICRYNHTVNVPPYMPCWLTVVCYLQGMPDRMLCAVLEQFQLYFSRWYVRFVSVSVSYPCIIVHCENGPSPYYMQPRYWSALQ